MRLKAGAGTLVLSGSNSFSEMFIGGGMLKLNNAGALNSGSPIGVLFGPNTPAGTSLTLNGNSITISNLGTTTPAGSAIVENASSAAVTLTIDTTAHNLFDGTMQNGIGGGSLAVTL